MSIGDWILVCLSVVAALPVAVIAVETLASLIPAKHRPAADTSLRPPCAVLIPAHDEGAGIGRPIAALRPQLADGDRLIVVADNCSDGTAAAARDAGAEVIERHDPD